MREDQERWVKLVDSQHGVVGFEQLSDFGVSWSAVRAHLAANRWQRVLPGVYSVFTGPLPRSSLISAALQYGGSWAVLSHRTAAEEWGMLPFEDASPVHITVPYPNSAISQPPLVQMHRSRAYRHIVAPTVPPRTNREDTIIDLAAAEPSAERARNTFVQLVGSTRIELWRVHSQLELRPSFRYRKVLKQALDLLRGGALSALEAEYVLKVEQEHGLPAGTRQVPFSVDGVVLWEDVAYDDVGARLTVRLDGRQFHTTSRIAFRDRRRDNAAELAGRSRLVYGWNEVHTDPCGVAAEVLQVLQRSGWEPRRKRCQNCS
ncbi:hypothetical protein E1288_33825 [Saccharopolyspora elongata]|uniref:Transcriptional regulator, AbiEi antitoxin, Type IV TA system n=1 Tax=Saccharopolyspora elongata TaxID=2530387 RepID=A0A4R4Y9A4_9PSEU|nr:hypothetical protein E1288_33825 [Saccharopolyspora elongata]